MREGFRGFQRFSEVAFLEVFQRPSQNPSQSAIFLSELRVVLPLVVLPLKTPTNYRVRSVGISAENLSLQIQSLT